MIKEWGVKFKLRNSNKISVEVSNVSGENAVGYYDAVARPTFKSEYLESESCTPGVSLYRTKQKEVGNTKLIDGYYYYVTGSPGPCPSPEDNLLKRQFLDDFNIENLSQL